MSSIAFMPQKSSCFREWGEETASWRDTLQGRETFLPTPSTAPPASCFLYSPHPLWGSLFFCSSCKGLKIHGASFSVVLIHSGFLQHLENAHHRVRTQCAVKKEWIGVCDCLAHLEVAGVTLSIGVGVWVGGASPSYCEKLWEVLRSFELCMRKCV